MKDLNEIIAITKRLIEAGVEDPTPQQVLEKLEQIRAAEEEEKRRKKNINAAKRTLKEQKMARSLRELDEAPEKVAVHFSDGDTITCETAQYNQRKLLYEFKDKAEAIAKGKKQTELELPDCVRLGKVYKDAATHNLCSKLTALMGHTKSFTDQTKRVRTVFTPEIVIELVKESVKCKFDLRLAHLVVATKALTPQDSIDWVKIAIANKYTVAAMSSAMQTTGSSTVKGKTLEESQLDAAKDMYRQHQMLNSNMRRYLEDPSMTPTKAVKFVSRLYSETSPSFFDLNIQTNQQD